MGLRASANEKTNAYWFNAIFQLLAGSGPPCVGIGWLLTPQLTKILTTLYSYVPCSQLVEYFFCSAVMVSILMFILASLLLAT